MSFFDDHFPNVREMLEDEARAKQAAPHKRWRITGLDFGQRVVESSHDSQEEAEAALNALLRTCAPFIRHTFRIEHRP